MIVSMLRTRGAILLVCASLSVATAETPQEKADRLFAEGRKALTAEDPKKACELFEQAIKLDVTATGTMLNLGLCYEKLHKYASSLYWFRKAQAAAFENKLTDYENAAKEHTALNAPKVSVLSITVSGAPDADIRLDGKKVEPTDYGRVEVDAGTHELVSRAAGKKKLIQTLSIGEAESKAITIEFSENAVAEYVDRGSGRRKGAIILGAAGVATLIGVGIYGFVEKSNYEDPMATKDEYDAAQKRLRYLGTGLFVVGLGAVAAGTILYLTAPGKEQISDGTAFAPVLAPDQVGFAFSGSF
jgi:tetratricopeptide (TPR) repeat protein